MLCKDQTFLEKVLSLGKNGEGKLERGTTDLGASGKCRLSGTCVYVRDSNASLYGYFVQQDRNCFWFVADVAAASTQVRGHCCHGNEQ